MQIDWSGQLLYRTAGKDGMEYRTATPEQIQAAADKNTKLYVLQNAAQYMLTELGRLSRACPHLIVQLHHLGADEPKSYTVTQCAECGKVL